MTESFYIRVDITSNETLEFYENEDDAAPTTASPAKNKRFNTKVEKALKRVLKENIELFEEYLEEMEGVSIQKQEALEGIVSEFYDVESDPTAIAEDMYPEIKFKVVRKIKELSKK